MYSLFAPLVRELSLRAKRGICFFYKLPSPPTKQQIPRGLKAARNDNSSGGRLFENGSAVGTTEHEDLRTILCVLRDSVRFPTLPRAYLHPITRQVTSADANTASTGDFKKKRRSLTPQSAGAKTTSVPPPPQRSARRRSPGTANAGLAFAVLFQRCVGFAVTLEI